jgi:hypothetical protein
MKVFKTLIIALIILVIFNYSPISYLLKENYNYTNYDHTFFLGEEGGKGYDFEAIKLRYKRFLEHNPDKAKTNAQLYRTFTIKPWRIWQWSDYIFQHDRFSLPYKHPDNIIER